MEEVGISFWDQITAPIYLGALVVLSLYFKRLAERSFEHYFLGGRIITSAILTGTFLATLASAATVVGIPGRAYTTGIAVVIFNMTMMNVIRTGMIWWAPVARRIFPSDLFTMPDIALHFYERGGQILSALLVIIQQIARIGAQVLGIGFLINFMFGIDIIPASIIGVAVSVAYVFLAGYWTVAITDVIQALVIAYMAALAFIVGFWQIGGWQGILDAHGAAGQQLHIIWHSGLHWTEIARMAIISVGLYASAYQIQRWMSARSPGQTQFSQQLHLFIHQLWMTCTGTIGLMAVYFVGTDIHGDTAIYETVATLLPPGLFGIWATAVLAAAMSTYDSSLLIAAAAVGRDLYQRWLRPAASDKSMIIVTRVAMIAFAVLSWFMSTQFDAIWDIWIWASGFMVPAVVVPFFLGLLWPWKRSRHAGWVCMSIGVFGYLALDPPYPMPWTPAVEGTIWGMPGFSILALWLLGAVGYCLVNLIWGKEDSVMEQYRAEKARRDQEETDDRATPIEEADEETTVLVTPEKEEEYRKHFGLALMGYVVLNVLILMCFFNLLPAGLTTAILAVMPVGLLAFAIMITKWLIGDMKLLFKVGRGDMSEKEFVDRTF